MSIVELNGARATSFTIVDVTVLGLVGGAPGGETPRVADLLLGHGEDELGARDLDEDLIRRRLRHWGVLDD